MRRTPSPDHYGNSPKLTALGSPRGASSDTGSPLTEAGESDGGMEVNERSQAEDSGGAEEEDPEEEDVKPKTKQGAKPATAKTRKKPAPINTKRQKSNSLPPVRPLSGAAANAVKKKAERLAEDEPAPTPASAASTSSTKRRKRG